MFSNGRSALIAPVLLLAGAWSTRAAAQCEPPPGSNEAKLLAFYEAPITFSPVAAPMALAPGSVRLDVEVVPIPTPSGAISHTGYCFQSKTEHTHLAPVFGRPRLTLGLPAGFVLEGSYVPPVTVGKAQPNLGSFALSNARRLPLAPHFGTLVLQLRAEGTVGQVRGPITCPASGLQTTQPTAPCYGTTPSRDTFHPYMFGGEGTLGFTTPGGRWSLYAGGGVTWLRPRFQVGFTDATGYTDRTQVVVNLLRGAAFGGVTAHLTHAFALSAQVYSVPADVTTVRFAAGYLLR